MGVPGRKKIKEIKKALPSCEEESPKKIEEPPLPPVADSGEEGEEGGPQKKWQPSLGIGAALLGIWGEKLEGNEDGGGAGQREFLGKREKSGREKIEGEKNQNQNKKSKIK